MKQPAHHTSRQRGTYQANWGSPKSMIDLVEAVCGKITLDLASSVRHNRRMKAKRIYTARDRCPYIPKVYVRDVIFCNPPGPGKNVIHFWRIWRNIVQARRGAFLIFNMDHWRQLPPLASWEEYWCLVFKKRQRFVGGPSSATFPSVLVFAPDSDISEIPEDAGHLFLWNNQR